MKHLILLTNLFLLGLLAKSQTNPAPVSLPYSQSFFTTTVIGHAPQLNGFASWTGSGAGNYSTQQEAALSEAGSDLPQNMGLSIPNAFGQYIRDDKLVISFGRNNTNDLKTSQLVLAFNSTGVSIVKLSYNIGMFLYDPRDFGICLQYRIGNSDSFTTVPNSSFVYGASTTNGGDLDGGALSTGYNFGSDVDSYSFILPAEVGNKPLVQLRWATWCPSGTGIPTVISIDEIKLSENNSSSSCNAPIAQPTIVSDTSTTSNSVSFTYNKPTPEPNGYIVLRANGDVVSPSQLPVNGTAYANGTVLGNATVIYSGSNNIVNATELSNNTQYTFFVFSYNNDSCNNALPLYLTSNPLAVKLTTRAAPLGGPCAAPTAILSNLVLTPTSNGVNISFSSSVLTDNYLIVRGDNAYIDANGAPPMSIAYNEGDDLFGRGTVVYYGSNTSFVDTKALPGTRVQYIVYPASLRYCTGTPSYSQPNRIMANVNTLPRGTSTQSVYYQSANGLMGQVLKTELSNIINTGVILLQDSVSLLKAIPYTEAIAGSGNDNFSRYLWDMYSYNTTATPPYKYILNFSDYKRYQCSTPSTTEGTCYIREYAFPSAWANGSAVMLNDLYNAIHTDSRVKTLRGNLPYGKVGSTATYTSRNGSKIGANNVFGYGGEVFEPVDEYKGDFARSILYMAVKYENQIAGWQNNANANEVLDGSAYKVFDDWYLKLLYKWHTQDPVSQKEIDRNNAIYKLQGNRNPFVDSMQFVSKIWGSTGLFDTTLVTICAAPTVQPITVSDTSTTINTIGFTFDKPTPQSNGYIVVRATGNVTTPTVLPSNGTTYTKGTVLGNTTVVYSGSNNIVSDSGLANNTQYTYFVYSYNIDSCTNGGGLYLTTNPLKVVLATRRLCAAPTLQPTTVSDTSTTINKIGFTFNKPTPQPNGYIVVRATGNVTAPTVLPSNGTTYTKGTVLGNTTVVYSGSNNIVRDSGLANNTQYTYFVYSYNIDSCSNGGRLYLTTNPLRTILKTRVDNVLSIALSPTLVTNKVFNMSISQPVNRNMPIRLYNSTGRLVATYTWPANTLTVRIQLANNITKGNYTIQVITPSGIISKQFIVVN